MKNKSVWPAVRIAAALLLFAGAGAIAFFLQSRYAMGPSQWGLSVQDAFFSLRNDVLNSIVIVLTHCGDTVTIIVLCAILLLLPSRLKYGVPVSAAALTGLAIYKPMKHIFLRARPDQAFHLVEQGGYSFPSGHTQSAVGTFGGAAYYNKKWKSFCIICVILAVLVPLSRMYLGVHTLKDVGVSVLIALVLIFAFKPIIDRIREKPHLMYILIFVMLALAVAFLLFVEFYAFPADLDIHNYESGVKSAYTLLGALLAFLPVYYLDEKYIHFQTKAPLKYQFLKVIIGFVLLILIRSGLKSLFGFIHFTHPVADSVRYFLVVFFAGTVYPLLFTKILSKKGV